MVCLKTACMCVMREHCTQTQSRSKPAPWHSLTSYSRHSCGKIETNASTHSQWCHRRYGLQGRWKNIRNVIGHFCYDTNLIQGISRNISMLFWQKNVLFCYIRSLWFRYYKWTLENEYLMLVKTTYLWLSNYMSSKNCIMKENKSVFYFGEMLCKGM